MATILLSTAGQALGGPIGATLGAMVGGGIDQGLGGRSARPEIEILSSAYGARIPAIFGRVRVAGNLIWASRTANRGKGDPGTSASFAIALAQGPIGEVGRIWADGRLLRDAAGLFETPVEVRVHLGTRGQTIDPLIAAVEGAASAPAYRGLAYVVFEDLDLARFGGRIPNLNFELVSDAGGGIGDWAAALAVRSGVPIGDCEAGESAGGYIASAGSVIDDLAVMASISDLSPRVEEARLALRRPGRFHAITKHDVGIGDPDQRSDDPSVRVSSQRDLAGWSVSHADPVRDYQRGVQTSSTGEKGMAGSTDVAITLDAAAAHAAAIRAVARHRAEADSMTLSLPWRWLEIDAGDRVLLGDRAWRVRQRDVVGLRVELRCTADWAVEPAGATVFASSLAALQLSALHPPVEATLMTLIELLVTPEEWTSTGPWVAAAAKRGTVIETVVNGIRRHQGEVRHSAILGRLTTTLPTGVTGVWDERHSIVVRLDDPAAVLETRPAATVAGGANRLWIGGEVIQFREAADLGANEVRLTGLLRGGLGTERFVGEHRVGEPVIALDEAALVPVRLPQDAIGGLVTMVATGPGDPRGGTLVDVRLTGLASMPLAPCHLRAWRIGNKLHCRWIARSRGSMTWSEGVPGDRPQTFIVTLHGDAGEARFITSESSMDFPIPQSALDRRILHLSVETLGEADASLRSTTCIQF